MRTLGIIASIGFVAALGVHVASLLGFDIATPFPYVFGLHVGIFVVFAPFVIFGVANGLNRNEQMQRAFYPGWVRTVWGVVLVYAVLNVFAALIQDDAGGPAIIGGRYVMANHGKIHSYLTEPEYHLRKAQALRFFSAFWMVMYLVPALGFLFKRAQPLTPSELGDAFPIIPG